MNSSTKKKNTPKRNTTGSKKTSTRKSTNTNNVKKDVVKKSESKNSKKIDKTSIILLSILIILFVVVCILFGVVLHKKNEFKKIPVANIVIPIVKLDNKMTFSLDLYSMKENEEYIFKVTNYRGNKVNDFDVNYSILLKNDTDAKIEVYRIGNETIDLMKNNEDKEIKDLKLYKNEKEDIYFKIVVSNLKNVKKKELASFMILS